MAVRRRKWHTAVRISVRRLYLVVSHITPAAEASAAPVYEQLDLFSDSPDEQARQQQDAEARKKEERLQQAMLSIKKRYGKNAILHATSYQEAATGRDRNKQIGGHKA